MDYKIIKTTDKEQAAIVEAQIKDNWDINQIATTLVGEVIFIHILFSKAKNYDGE